MPAFFRKILRGVEHGGKGYVIAKERLVDAHAQDKTNGEREFFEGLVQQRYEYFVAEERVPGRAVHEVRGKTAASELRSA